MGYFCLFFCNAKRKLWKFNLRKISWNQLIVTCYCFHEKFFHCIQIAQCGNCRNSLSHFVRKNFVKAMKEITKYIVDLTKKNSFRENFSFFHTAAVNCSTMPKCGKTKNFLTLNFFPVKSTTYLVILLVKHRFHEIFVKNLESKFP